MQTALNYPPYRQAGPPSCHCKYTGDFWHYSPRSCTFLAKEHLRVVLGRDLPSGPIGQNSGKAEPNTSLNYSYFLSSLRGHTHSNLSKALILKVLSDISRSLSFLFHPFSPPLWKEPCHSTLAFLGCLPSADKDPAMQAGTGSLPEGTGSPQGPSEPLCESGSQCHTVCEMGRP